MRILVYDVAAEDGGGLFVLKNFYNDILNKSPINIEWIIMTSIDMFEDTEHIKIVCYKKVKKSWFHRLWFENMELPGIIEKINPDLLISLQNMPVKKCNRQQFVYLHQSLQYCPKKFSFFKKTECMTAIRQHIICGMIKNILPKADHIFVQTEWIKEATKDWLRVRDDKITVVPVAFDRHSVPMRTYMGQNSNVFFYPARAEVYKNHDIIIEACKLLVEKGIDDFKVLFTINHGDGAYAEQIYRNIKGLPIEFIGSISYDEIWEYYSKTILVFPSYLETCGLPMVEAKAAGAKILASDMPFSHEVLDGYPNAEFFAFDNAQQLADKMRYFLMEKRYEYVNLERTSTEISLMESMLKKI